MQSAIHEQPEIPDTIIVRPPHPALASFIDCFWFYRAGSIGSRPELLLPHGAFELVMSLSGDVGDSLIAGPHTRGIVVDPASQQTLAGAHFRAGGVAALFGHSAHQFRDRDVQLVAVLARSGREMHERLQGISDSNRALSIMERSLLRHIEGARAGHAAVEFATERIHRLRGQVSIASLVDDTGLSQRRFIELFKDEVGLSPKLYARIQRFQHTLRRASSQANPDWSALAYDGGYADQSHLIREFQAFAGITPGQYQSRWPQHPGHVPLT